MVGGEVTPLGAEDARLLALEAGPIRGHTVRVLLVADSPGGAAVPALRSAIEARLGALPRWRQRLVPAPDQPSGLGWQDDPTFEVARHVNTVHTSDAVDGDELRRIVAAIMATPLDRGRPLWTVDVVPRLADGRWAIVWKVHHALADGVTAMRAGARLLWTEPASSRRQARPATGAPSGVASSVVAAGRAATLAGYRGLVLREFRRVWALSPLAAEVGPDRAVAFARCRLDELRAIGRAIAPAATINDVLLAVVAGALRRWLAERHAPRARLKVQIPVSMHPHLGDDDPFGNRDSFLFVKLPLGDDDPVARLRAVRRATRLRKNRQDARAIDALRAWLAHAPAPLQRALQRLVQGPHEYSLNVSNVPGPLGPIEVIGRRVDELYALAEVAPHHALRVAAVSLGGWLFIGLCADPHVVPDLELLTAGIGESVDELRQRLELAPPPPGAGLAPAPPP